MLNNLMSITIPGIPEHLYVLSNDEIREGDSVLYKETFLDGTVKTELEYHSNNWVLMKEVPADCLPAFHRAQQGRNAQAGIAGCHKIIMSTNTSLGVPCPIILSPEQLRSIISISHATGWNDARSNKITWSDTSFNQLKNKLIDLFNIEL
jgi:hypothetical protein